MPTPEDVIAVFEQINIEGKDFTRLEDACAGFAQWLAVEWEGLRDEEVRLLMAVGATLWREASFGGGSHNWRPLS
ncbi:hypothetical protein [Caballeronia ptereochthonis]|uniref:hypothetical protein n=1 Tax=Caballeronia ptereochthonis TaxID=1777144 RepID=UPI000B35B416|nr:hypothetical protein [Caballeronia ptereochthonis]